MLRYWIQTSLTPLLTSDLQGRNTTLTPTMTPPQALWACPTTTAPWCTTVKTPSETAPSPPLLPRSPLSVTSSASVWSSVTATCSSCTASTTAVRVNHQHMSWRSLLCQLIMINNVNISCQSDAYLLISCHVEKCVWAKTFLFIVQPVYRGSKSHTCVCVYEMSPSKRLHVPGLMWLWTREHLRYDPGPGG